MPAPSQLNITGFGIEQADLPPYDQGIIDLQAWFDQPQPMQLEIGTGKGTFLVQEAPLHPTTNFLGLEYARAFYRHAADRMRRLNVTNVRILHCEAAMFLRNYVADGLFEQVHVYFPDPWPKTRHHKRRLIQEPTLREFHRILATGGCVRLATDHADYFTWMEDHIGRVMDIFERKPFESPASAGEGELVGTNFERKYRREGRSFNGMVLRKR